MKTVVLLNGPSSSGKSTISRNLQSFIYQKDNQKYEVVSIDDFMKISTSETIYEDDVFEISEDMCRKVVELLDTFDGVIVDHVITSERIYKRFIDMAMPYRLLTVHVSCPLNTLLLREQERGNRCLGSAQNSFDYLYPKDNYDLTINSGLLSKEQCVEEVYKLINKPSIAFIWDLDGTVLDSYGVIVDSLYQIYKEKGFDIDKQEIYRVVINESVSYFIKKMEERFGVPFDDLKDRYTVISHNAKGSIKAMKHAKEILKFIKEHHLHNFVFTHRGVTTESVLKNIELFEYFDEIVNSVHGYARKPSPDGLNYLIDKYHLDRNNTYYVGDRPMDIKCANNAHIKSIMFIPEGSPAIETGQETFVIKDLLQIKEIINFQ